MCGIVGGVCERDVVPILLEGLSRLEYRGYDSVGVAIIDENHQLYRERVFQGRVKGLTEKCIKQGLKSSIGIGHTRWATHGGVTLDNAHPHFSNDTLAIVHNGIIENYQTLREDLQKKGYVFESQTDTEVIVHLIHSFYVKSNDLLHSVKQAVKLLHGAYAIGVMDKNHPQELIVARFGSPLVLGLGIGEMFFASDISALLPVTQKVVYLEEGDIAKILQNSFTIYDANDKEVVRPISVSELSISYNELGHYRHYMQKEIFEQPGAIADTIQALGDKLSPSNFGVAAQSIFKKITKVQIIACGTSYNAGLVAKYWFEKIANLECSVDIASEYRYRHVVVNHDTLVISISQSGETADTLACIKHVIGLGMENTLSICNVSESSLVRISKLGILTKAGPEIGVASTKAFTTQLVVLLYLVNTIALVKGLINSEEEDKFINEFRKLPHLVLDYLALESHIKILAQEFKHVKSTLFLGRNLMYPIAIEGALKLKEISYIHAESYAAGELKHGPLALIDNELPVIVLLPTQILFDKMSSSMQEVLARQGKVYVFTDSKDENLYKTCSVIPVISQEVLVDLLPILYAIPTQLLAYHVAIIKGTDVDKPRNLAKSVTVE